MSRIEDLVKYQDKTAKLSLQIQKGIRTGDTDSTYDALAQYTVLMIAGGESVRDKSAEVLNSQLFAQTLQEAIDSIRQDQPRRGLSELLKWNSRWDDLTPETVATVLLPPHLMPIAVRAIRVCRDAFDDSAQFISPRFRKKQAQAVLGYLDWAHGHIKDPTKPVNPGEAFDDFGLQSMLPFRQ
ncbi:hypothetical protein HY387_00890 [Candidatus Daviesbacteria bacterium]|nr:hypothetical protein [Candidatus Daviesbacteria bacterium]